jgi:hypothetical protein
MNMDNCLRIKLRDHLNHKLLLLKNLKKIDESISKIDYLNLCNANNIEDISKSIKIIENCIYETCSHIFVEDLIDINPDESKMIKYCEVCHMTV